MLLDISFLAPAHSIWVLLQVSTLNLFKTIMDDQKSLPRDQPHKDLINLINFILRKFFKALTEEPFLAVEVCPPFFRLFLQ
jgi:replication fork protection complex subunit Tof1/Swi1